MFHSIQSNSRLPSSSRSIPEKCLSSIKMGSCIDILELMKESDLPRPASAVSIVLDDAEDSIEATESGDDIFSKKLVDQRVTGFTGIAVYPPLRKNVYFRETTSKDF